MYEIEFLCKAQPNGSTTNNKDDCMHMLYASQLSLIKY